MLKKRLLPLVLCLALLIPLAACQGGGYKEIKPPVEKLNWGMTQEEALKALSLEDDEIYKNNSDGTSWDLTYEQAGMGDSVAGLTLSTTPNHSTGVNLLFNTYDQKATVHFWNNCNRCDLNCLFDCYSYCSD